MTPRRTPRVNTTTAGSKQFGKKSPTPAPERPGPAKKVPATSRDTPLK